MSENQLLTILEVAEMLQLKPATIRAWVLRRERLPYIKVGRLVRFRRDVEALIRAGYVPAREVRP
jgi:excisionase family DNA binding protein